MWPPHVARPNTEPLAPCDKLRGTACNLAYSHSRRLLGRLAVWSPAHYVAAWSYEDRQHRPRGLSNRLVSHGASSNTRAVLLSQSRELPSRQRSLASLSSRSSCVSCTLQPLPQILATDGSGSHNRGIRNHRMGRLPTRDERTDMAQREPRHCPTTSSIRPIGCSSLPLQSQLGCFCGYCWRGRSSEGSYEHASMRGNGSRDGVEMFPESTQRFRTVVVPCRSSRRDSVPLFSAPIKARSSDILLLALIVVVVGSEVYWGCLRREYGRGSTRISVGKASFRASRISRCLRR